MRRQGRNRQGLSLWAMLIPIALVFAALRGLPTSYSLSEQESPVIEYSLTRVFGGEDWSIHQASLSPDGRWVAFAAGDATSKLNLWLVSTGSGEPIPLTTGPYFDDSPVWFPSGDRIAFRSNRTPIFAIMTLPLDPLTGRPTGPPRQVTIESNNGYFDVSPDGRWIACNVASFPGESLLKILPARGGIARTLAEGVLAPIWSSDGKSIYYVASKGQSQEHALMRVTIEEGHPQTVFTWPGEMMLMSRGAGRNFILREPMNAPGFEIADLAGRAIGRVVMPRGMSPMAISQKGDRILGIRKERSAPLKILPVDGGPARRLNEAGAYDEALGWSPDSRRVLFETRLDGKSILLYAPVAGGPMRQVKLPEERSLYFDPILSGDGKHLFYTVNEGTDEVTTLKVFSIEEDRSWELSRTHTFRSGVGGQLELTGAGGALRRDGADYLYYEKRSNSYELHAAPPRGSSRLLWTFDGKPPRSASVHGERIAWVENSEGEAALLLANVGESFARLILNRQGMFDMPVWSPDSKRIAVYYYDPARSSGQNWDPAGRDLVVLEVDLSGKIIGKPERYSIPAGHWWSPRWLPDGRKILVVGMDGDIWLIPLEPGARPVAITQDDPASVWHCQLSPDGGSIAYASLAQRGSSIWLLELEGRR